MYFLPHKTFANAFLHFLMLQNLHFSLLSCRHISLPGALLIHLVVCRYDMNLKCHLCDCGVHVSPPCKKGIALTWGTNNTRTEPLSHSHVHRVLFLICCPLIMLKVSIYLLNTGTFCAREASEAPQLHNFTITRWNADKCHCWLAHCLLALLKLMLWCMLIFDKYSTIWLVSAIFPNAKPCKCIKQ